jgi:hypothetical protein
VMSLFVADAQDAPTRHRQSSAPENVHKVALSGWTQDETIFSKTIFLRAKNLEEKTGFRFDKNWEPKVCLEWSLGTTTNGSNAIYKADTQTTYFPVRILYELTARHKGSSDSLNAETAASDDELAEIIDHELGHELMDQVSRRNGLGAWFTEKRFNASTDAQKLGLDIVSEGTAQYFQRVNFPRDDSDLSELTFPATAEQQKYYTYRMIAYDGGYWIVRDVLSKHGERGLIWLMRHPFVAGYDMRAAAATYRELALKDLSQERGR